MTFNYVASGYQNNKPIILKIGLNSKALAKEASCLKAFAKHAVAEVIAHDNNMIIVGVCVSNEGNRRWPKHRTTYLMTPMSQRGRLHPASQSSIDRR